MEKEIRMRTLKRASFIIALLLLTAQSDWAQTAANEQAPATASITGKVLLNGRPAPHATVTAIFEEQDARRMLQLMSEGFASLRSSAKTDSNGEYRIESLRAGRYQVFVMAPAMVSAPAASNAAANPRAAAVNDDDDDDDEQNAGDLARDDTLRYSANLSKQVTVADGETAKGVNFSMKRGGVVTGRVVYPDDRPVIGAVVNLATASGGSARRGFSVNFEDTVFTTDDRGIYRIYGVNDGAYKVYMNLRPNGLFDVISGRGGTQATYYPNVTDENLAATVEVRGGNEVRGIDIKLGAAAATFAVSGRVIEAETGKPMPNVMVFYNGSSVPFGKAKTPTNGRGEFKLEEVPSGSYELHSGQGILEQSEYYAEAVRFEVNAGDVTGIELKLRRGMTVSGVAAIDSTGDPALLAKLNQKDLMLVSSPLNPSADQAGVPGFAQTKIAADGSFRFVGVRPGRVNIGLPDVMGASGVALVRIERSGAAVTSGVDLQAGESINDLRLIFAEANGVVRGSVRVEGGVAVKDVDMTVQAKPVGASNDGQMDFIGQAFARGRAQVDPNGNFVIEGLVAGEYELTLMARMPPKSPDGEPLMTTVTQTVSVRGNGETQVQLTVDLKARDK